MALADCAAEAEPGVADVMRSAGQLAQAAVEAQADKLAHGLFGVLAEPGSAKEPTAQLSGAAVRDAVNQVLRTGLGPLSPGLAAEQLAETVAELDKQGQTALRNYQGDQTTGGDGFEGLSGQALLDGGAQVAARAAGVIPPRFGTEPVNYYFGAGAPEPRWWLTASLELPESLAGTKPVRCIRPQHSVLGDKVRVMESTINNLDVDNALVTRDRVRPGSIGDLYRPTLNADYVTEFADVVSRPVDQRAYVCRAIIEPDCRALRTTGRAVAAHREEIKAVAASAADAALQLILQAGPAGQVAAPLAGLLQGLPGILTAHLVDALTRVLEPRSLPAWVISHTVIWADRLPLSIFLVQCPDEERRRMRLHGLTGKEVDGLPEISAEYRDRPKRLYNYGRLMWGASQPDGKAYGMPQRLWEVVDSTSQPVVWTNPEFDRRGFRLLVPQKRDKACYVTALRADIRFS